MSRPQSPPPKLAGLTVVRHLGGGGFADVYLYEQQALGRQVAVKVLRANASSPEVRREFAAESNLMAALSDHQNIVTIHDAAISEDGRPYLVMAYYPETLSQRYKAGQLTVEESLAIGVELAGAVETLHRQHILHRDIKPANVLSTKGGRPALTDFGISVSANAPADAARGMSVPWSPPEIIAGDGSADHRADIYSLTATIYTLLAGRSPFESRTLSNQELELMDRVQRAPLPPVGRPDVPTSLERVLARGLARQAEYRYASALDLARALQQVEKEMTGKSTPVDVLDEDPLAATSSLGEDDGNTRIRRLHTIHAQGPATGRPADGTLTRNRPAPAADATALRGGSVPNYLDPSYLQPVSPADTLVRPGEATVLIASAPPRTSRMPLVIAGVAVVVAAAVIAVLVLSGSDDKDGGEAVMTPSVATDGGEPAIDLGAVPSVEDLAAETGPDGVTFTWTNPDPRPDDVYFWRRTDLGNQADQESVTEEKVVIPGTGSPCIEVQLARSNGSYSDSVELCEGRG